MRFNTKPTNLLNMNIPPKVLKALNHVRSFYPDVRIVVYSNDYRCHFMYNDFNSPIIRVSKLDIGILEDAAEDIREVPAVFQLPNEL